MLERQGRDVRFDLDIVDLGHLKNLEHCKSALNDDEGDDTLLASKTRQCAFR